jgi:hypothetical protein
MPSIADCNPAATDGDFLRMQKLLDCLTLYSIRKLTSADDFISAAGDVAHDAVDAGSPLKMGGKTPTLATGYPTAVAAGDRVNAWLDTFGRFNVKNHGKDSVVLLSSAARTAATNSTNQVHPHIRGMTIVTEVTAITATPIITPTLQITNPVTGTWVTIATAGAISATGVYVWQIFPGITPDTDGPVLWATSLAVPQTSRLAMLHDDTDSITYSVGAYLEI